LLTTAPRHTTLHFLKEGYRVRGTVRSESKGEYLRQLFSGKGEFEYVIVDDITKVSPVRVADTVDFPRLMGWQEGVFDEAVKDVDAVAHLASPFYVAGVKDPQELIGPALKGTTGVLKSIQKIK
jgi:nucleoside-diphosphate-sugar epimerase